MRGVDIHPVYQANVNWPVLGGTDCEFVWVKVSDGNAAYKKWVGGKLYTPDAHIKNARQQGMSVGGYHYAQFGDPIKQADLLCKEVRRLGALTLPPALDIEDPFNANSLARDFAYRFCKRVHDSALRPAVYMNSSMASVLKPNLWGIPGLVIWIADYGANDGRRHPSLYPYEGRADVHQYTSKGHIAGIPGDVDLNYPYNTSFMTVKPSPTPQRPEEDEMSAKAERQIDELHAALRIGKVKVQTPGVLTRYIAETVNRQRKQDAQIATLIKLAAAKSDLTEDNIRSIMKEELEAAGVTSIDDQVAELAAQLNADDLDPEPAKEEGSAQ